MSYLDALRDELADCKQRNKTARVKAIEAEIARVSKDVRTADAVPVVETAAVPKRKTPKP